MSSRKTSRKTRIVLVFCILVVVLSSVYFKRIPLSRTLIQYGTTKFSHEKVDLGRISYNLALQLNSNFKDVVNRCLSGDEQENYDQVINYCDNMAEIEEKATELGVPISSVVMPWSTTAGYLYKNGIAEQGEKGKYIMEKVLS